VLGPIFNYAGKNRIDFEDIVNNHRLFICNLSGVGTLRKQFMARFLSNALEQAVMDRPPEARAPFLFLFDEFPLYYSRAVEEIVTQGRKFGASMVLAHQNLEQLTKQAQSAIIGNVGTIVSFAIGQDYARTLMYRFPGIDPSMLCNLLPYHTLTTIEGQVFRMQTYDNPAVNL